MTSKEKSQILLVITMGQCKNAIAKEGVHTVIEMEWRFSIAINSVDVMTLVAIKNRRSITPTVIALNHFNN